MFNVGTWVTWAAHHWRFLLWQSRRFLRLRRGRRLLGWK